MARFNLGRQRGGESQPEERRHIKEGIKAEQTVRWGGAGGWLRDGRAGGCSNLEIISKVKFKYPPESGRKEKQTRRHSALH